LHCRQLLVRVKRHQAEHGCFDYRFGAVNGIELPQYSGHIILNSLLADIEIGGNLFIQMTDRNETQYLYLPER
jgi:hypothetical protein